MIATCQICRQMIMGPQIAFAVSDEVRAAGYRQLSMLVSAHMSARHEKDAGSEIMAAMALSGAAIAMRYVASSDTRVYSERTRASERLVEIFTPEPVPPLPEAPHV